MVTTNTTVTNINEQGLQSWLQQRLSEQRYQHSLGAQQKAIEIARNFKLSESIVEKAGLAGLLHDAAKLSSPAELLEMVTMFNIDISDAERESPQVLHPFVGAELARWELNIQDEDVLNAIRYHTTGRAGMSDVEKLVYLADKIEGNTRNPLYTQKITSILNYQDPTTLDKAVLYIMDSTITFLIEKGQVIHPRTVEARNDLVNKLKSAQDMGGFPEVTRK